MSVSLRRPIAATLLSLAVLTVQGRSVAGQTTPARRLESSGLPTRLTDAEFWKLVTDGSEPGGYFPSDNFTSNEITFPTIIAALRTAHDTGGVYLGVGPEQNFSYMTGIRPRMAFLVDIRRQSVIQHLMYKAIFELSKDRADFVSLLFSKPRPAGLDTTTSIANIWEAYWEVRTDTAIYPKNLARIKEHLTRAHGFALDSADLASLTYVYEAFYRLGPIISYSGYGAASGFGSAFSATMTTGAGVTLNSFVVSSNVVSGTVGGISVLRSALNSAGSLAPLASNRFNTLYYGGTNFASLTASTDVDGTAASFLATEDNFRFMKDLETRNLFVPVVGDFAGPKAIRGVGQYVRDHGATITAFYVSNVEQYLFQNNVWGAFYENVGTLPVTPNSVFIRGGSSICLIADFILAFNAGRITRVQDANACIR